PALEVVGEHPQRRLRHAPDPPEWFLRLPAAPPGLRELLRIHGPRPLVAKDVVRRAHRMDPRTSGRSRADRTPGGALHTAGTALTNRIAVAIRPPEFSSPPSPSSMSSHFTFGDPSITTR